MLKLLKNRYNAHLLCLSSLIYLFAGLVVFNKNPYFSILLFIVTIFSILYHKKFRNFSLKVLDWVFGTVLAIYLYYLFRIRFDKYIFSFLFVLLIFRLADHVLFKTRRYEIFSYSHSLWHLLTGIVIVLMFILGKI